MNNIEKSLKDLVGICGYITSLKEKWVTETIDVNAGRSSESPVNKYYNKGHELCSKSFEMSQQGDCSKVGVLVGEIIEPYDTLINEFRIIDFESLSDVDAKNKVESIISEIEKDYMDRIKEKKKTMDEGKGKGKGESKDEVEDKDVVKGLSKVKELSELVSKVDNAKIKTLIERKIILHDELTHQKNIAKQISLSLGVRGNSGPSESEWQELAQVIGSQIDNCKNGSCRGDWCSLIYSYWLDEAGLPWAVERLADRIENGVITATKPLQAIRISEGSSVANVISKFTSIWHQGDLAAVDERRRQYQAVYGFPLYSASRLGRLNTVDPRHNFPSAFHRFLVEIMRFQKDSRNLQIKPDIQPVVSAFNSLANSLMESNENLRRVRPPEVRGQMEYYKNILGGYKQSEYTTANAVNELYDEWKSRLPGRPGLQDTLDPWEYVVDTVAGLYSWQRPGIRDYVTLAEHGEQILVFCRIIASDKDKVTDGVMRAFLAMMENSFNAYVNAYKIVTRVDLARKPFLGTPAEAMARSIKPPVVSPLNRSWSGENVVNA